MTVTRAVGSATGVASGSNVTAEQTQPHEIYQRLVTS